MRHTIVIEIPDHADPDLAERRLTQAVEAIYFARDYPGQWLKDFPKVVEYHHEQMTSTEES